jgi:hypothetical protein
VIPEVRAAIICVVHLPYLINSLSTQLKTACYIAILIVDESHRFNQEASVMRKVQLTAVVWTMILAIPLTALALSAVAYTTEHLTQISTAIARFSLTTSAGGRGWAVVTQPGRGR